MNPSNLEIILFYSNRCPHCRMLIDKMTRANLIDKCILVCLEQNPEKFPAKISSVPTILTNTISRPLIGDAAIEWIENYKYFDQTTNNIRKNNVINPTIPPSHDGLEYDNSDSNKIKNKYTTIDDQETKTTPTQPPVIDKPITETKISDNEQTENLKKTIQSRRIQLLTKLRGISKIK